MEQKADYLGISDSTWRVIGILVLVALLVMTFVLDVGASLI